MKKEIAILDENCVLIAVSAVSDDDYVTDAKRKTVRLPPNHDMADRLRSYRFDFNTEKFEPIIVLGKSGEGAMDFGDAVVEALLMLSKKVGAPLSIEILHALGVRPNK